MRRFRFTIASLLVVVLFVALGFAALRESSDLWESGDFTLTLAALLISILFAVHHIESRRAFWIGFTLFGWIYLGLSLVPSIESRLITTKAFAYLDSKLACRSVRGFSVRSSATNSGIPSNQVQVVAKSVLKSYEAPIWAYQAAKDYAERYDVLHGSGLIPSSAPMVEEIDGFWRKYYGIKE